MPLNAIPAIETKIVQLLKEKDDQAIKLIFKAYGRALYGVIYQLIGKQEDSEEALQDVLVKIWNKSDYYDDTKGRLYTWMLNIARNTAIDKVRSKINKQNSKTDTHDILVHESIGSTAIKPEIIGVKELTNLLSTEQKEVIELAYFQGYTQQEIADELNMPLGSVKTKVRSALIFLKEHLKNEY